jgi:MFS family permease
MPKHEAAVSPVQLASPSPKDADETLTAADDAAEAAAASGASGWDDGEESPEVRAIGGIVTAAFALGQIVGPLLGSFLTSKLGFEAASALMASALSLLVPLVACGGRAGSARRVRLSR